MSDEHGMGEGVAPAAGADGGADRRFRGELRQHLEEIRTWRHRRAQLKAEMKSAREAEATAVSAMMQVIAQYTDDLPLFPEPAGPEDWRQVSLAQALQGVPASIIQALAEAELATVGDLADFSAADRGRCRLTDLEGIGPAKAEIIERALEEFWQRRKDAGANETLAPGQVIEPEEG